MQNLECKMQNACLELKSKIAFVYLLRIQASITFGSSSV